ncbi:MAG: glycosyl hydrolase family 28-related protein [Thermomicrobiales bacterium]
MDHEQFDRLSRRIAGRLSRRTLAGLAGVGLVALAAAPTGVDAKKKKKTCKGELTRCSVKKGKKKKTICVNAQTDTAHCGGCGQACPGSQSCVNGECSKGACTPDAKAVTCGSKCGEVQNNCQQTVKCGACGCLPVSDTAVLQAAIDDADPGDTVLLCAGTWTITETLTISDDLTLQGAGAGQTILDGGAAVRVLWIDDADADVEVEDLTIQRGYKSGLDNRGGGIRNDGTLSLTGVVVTDCGALWGGGINNKGTLDLFNGTEIRGNRAEGQSGGGIDAESNSKTTLHDGSLISGNQGNSGGGIHLYGCSLTLESGSRVKANRAIYYDGGGIYGTLATILLQDGSVVGGAGVGDGNTANNVGGGLSVSSSTVTLESGSKVIGNSAVRYGAGLLMGLYGTTTLKAGSRVTGNAGGNYAGAALAGPITVEAGAIVCDNTPLNKQCDSYYITSNCPQPASGVCPV